MDFSYLNVDSTHQDTFDMFPKLNDNDFASLWASAEQELCPYTSNTSQSVCDNQNPFFNMDLTTPELDFNDNSPDSVFMCGTPITPAINDSTPSQWCLGDLNDISLSAYISNSMNNLMNIDTIDINTVTLPTPYPTFNAISIDSDDTLRCLFPPLDGDNKEDIVNTTPTIDPVESLGINNLFDMYVEADYVPSPSDMSVTTTKTRKRRATKPKATYSCAQCGKIFNRRYNLSTHEVLHNPKRLKKFDCKRCPKRFDRKNDLERHTSTVHDGERPFPCILCPERFSRKDALARHMTKKHT